MTDRFLIAMGWLGTAELLGYGISAYFSGRLHWPRRKFLIPYVLLISLFLWAFWAYSEIDVVALLSRNWVWGLVAGVLVGAFLVESVQSQPASRKVSGWALVLDILWVGLAYGLVDGLFLNVMPVLAVWGGLSQMTWTATWAGKVAQGLLALAGSWLVTLVYHLGYKEFRDRKMMLVVLGNSLMTLAFILSGNPLGAVLSHMAMHVAAVLQGAETTVQLPPHTRHL